MTDYKSFDCLREDFKPYGLTCERWIPRIMPRTDRHNEIELNYIISGSISYFFRDRTVTVPAGRIVLFWGLIPHRIISSETDDFYFVCTVPLSMFLEWKLPENMVNNIFAGEILVDSSESKGEYDKYMFSVWEKEISTNPDHFASILEIRARLLRFGNTCSVLSQNNISSSPLTSKIEKLVLFIARSYADNLTAKEISDVAGVTPDYANVLFKKTFGHSLMKHVMMERITQAQRELLFTDKLISHIAMDCGYNSVSCFNSAFRQLNNCSPSEFRAAYMKRRPEKIVEKIL